jgi:3'5'-cyclic nucleotide phosphodiesterase
LDEIKEVIPISKHVTSPASMSNSAGEMNISDDNLGLTSDVINDLREYVSIIAKLYDINPFHNFEHACHVTMSGKSKVKSLLDRSVSFVCSHRPAFLTIPVNKLLKRIISTDTQEIEECADGDTNEVRLHNYTYGLCHDHMASFAIVFSALIHDVYHKGCSNNQLAIEEPSLGIKYRNQSVAEQNSIDISWNLLMESRFDRLRSVIFGNQEGLMRFRQFIVNLVLATDIFDKRLNDMRKQRWIRAFSADEALRGHQDQADRKATIVIVHLMQASDISHTMQHWQIYRKWNKLLFEEMYLAYQAGRMAADPVEFWYEGEIRFFDNYVLPLAKQLQECNVFGVSSDEYLNFASKFDYASL